MNDKTVLLKMTTLAVQNVLSTVRADLSRLAANSDSARDGYERTASLPPKKFIKGMNRFRTVSHQWAENPYLEGRANFMKQESEVAKADRTTVAADKLKQLMSEVISLREKVAQAEFVATGCRVRPQNPSTGPKPNCLMLKRSVLTNLLN